MYMQKKKYVIWIGLIVWMGLNSGLYLFIYKGEKVQQTLR